MSSGPSAAAPATPRRQADAGAMRRTMFLSQDGVVLCTTLRALDELQILEPSLAGDRSLAELQPGLTEPGFGALRVVARCLASVGWLSDEPTLDPETTVLRWTEAGRLAMRWRTAYVALGGFLAGFSSTAADAWTRPWAAAQVEAFRGFVARARDRWLVDDDLPEDLASVVVSHLDAGLIVPTMLWLHETGRLSEVGAALPDDGAGQEMQRLLDALGWVDLAGAWTDSGRQARAFALNFGGVATYLPLLARLPELFRGKLTVTSEKGAPEWHVHRELNLRISANAHRRYFADSDRIFLELFDREPIERQPRFIADIGCGDGSWLVHLHELITDRTRRGQSLDSQPLVMVGIDPDATALAAARENLDRAGVPALLLEGDVTDPDGLAESLAKHGLAIEDGLHVRAFVDHEREYLGGDRSLEAPGWASGAYLDSRGAPIAGDDLERDLIAHMRRWARHVQRHGLVVLEAHSVPPRVARRQLGALHSVAFDAHQGYSQQYPVDHQAFVACCRQAGLQSVGHQERRYPSKRPFVSITLNRLLAGRADEQLPATAGERRARDGEWRPHPAADLEDGIALHRLLFDGGDIRYPASWHSAATGFVVAGALEAIEERLERADRGETIRVLDYGAGTGTATIELLKACRERGIEQRLEARGAALEVQMIDLPSSWFAQGHALLRDCDWVRFHSLRADDGGFRPLSEITRGVVDAAIANMVFHLIPPRALENAAGQIAAVLAPGGRLLWSAPDLGPPGPYAVLLHDPNRELRRRWLELIDPSSPESAAPPRGNGSGGRSPRFTEALRRARDGLDREALEVARQRAERRILPRPLAADVGAALARHFEGEAESRTYEMPSGVIVDGLLVPSNQTEYLPEIADRAQREDVIRELMLEEVLPAMREGPAGTALGLNLQWTLGAFAKR